MNHQLYSESIAIRGHLQHVKTQGVWEGKKIREQEQIINKNNVI